MQRIFVNAAVIAALTAGAGSLEAAAAAAGPEREGAAQADPEGAAPEEVFEAPTVDDGPADPEGEPELGAEGTPPLFASGWTPYTSEEDPPITCIQARVSEARCRGSYCDDLSFYCESTDDQPRSATWSAFFSEEGDGRQICGNRAWITGLACRDAYCDNITVQCTRYPQSRPRGCRWTGWHSEERGGRIYFGDGFYARGIQCEGAYCDNKRYYVCRDR